MQLKIHKNLQLKELITELKFCFVLFENNQDIPWIMLASKKNAKNMLDLTTQERLLLMQEIEICEKAMFKIFQPFQTNVAMLGNKTPWLHVHIICRKQGDAAWPNSPFEMQFKPFESLQKKEETKKQIKLEIENLI